MPIIVEKPQFLTAEDMQDLHKVYKDYPLSQPLARIAVLNATAKSDRWSLYVARFNGRLLGACWIERYEHTALIHDICVRDLTRGRGIALRMLQVCNEHFSNLQFAKLSKQIKNKEAVIKLATKAGLQVQNSLDL